VPRAERALLVGLVVTLALFAGARATEAAAVPRSFFGVDPQAPLSEGDLAKIGDLHLTMRMPFTWSSIETAPGIYDFSATDEQITTAAARGIRVLPVLDGSPAWVGSDGARPPRTPAALALWRRFVSVVVRRYGSTGTFWAGRSSRVPVLSWQIWNEPNFPVFWEPRPEPAPYARLLHVAAGAIRAGDPKARVVVAGLAPIEGEIHPWAFLRRLYAVPGFRRDADVVALHPYAPTLGRLYEEIRLTRRVMTDAGAARTPLLISEFGVASQSEIPTSYDLGIGGQALYLEQGYRHLIRMRRRWHLAGAYWYAWQDIPDADPDCVFCQGSGLFDGAGQAKPSWFALRRLVTRSTAGSLR
jgi:hypothetical protein